MHEKLLDLSAEFFGFSYFLSNAGFDLKIRSAREAGECLYGVSLFMLRTVILPAVSIIFLNVTFTLDMSFSSDFSLSAESDQETASLTIDKSPVKCEVGGVP